MTEPRGRARVQTPQASPAREREPETRSVTGAEAWLEAVDFDRPVRSAPGFWFRTLAWVACALAFVGALRTATAPLRAATPARIMNDDAYEGHRYGMVRARREAIFEELAAAELVERARAVEQNTWGGHLWSREDDRGQRELAVVHALATKYGVSITQIYLVLDEAIRDHWPAPNGEPLPATTPPQDPRSTW